MAVSTVPGEGQSVMPRARGADYRVDGDTGCWVWLRYVDRQGCARVNPSSTVREQRAHREYYRRAKGEIPAGLDLVRRCSEPRCVNPDHHEAMSHDRRLAEVHQAASPLTAEDVRAIRSEVRQGVKQDVLCRRYGITSASMSNIVMGKTWKDSGYRPGVERVCALEECEVRFVTRRSNQRFCCGSHRGMHNSRAQHRNGYLARRLAGERERGISRRNKSAIYMADSLDRRLADDGSTLGELVASPESRTDPLAQVETGRLRELVGGMGVEAAERLSEPERLALARRLSIEGYRPSVQRSA